MQEGLTFDDVCLVPKYNNVKSRTEPDLHSWLTKGIRIDMPLVPANMDTVIGMELAQVIAGYGGMPIFHRFTSFDEQERWVNHFEGKCILSCGVGKFDEVSKLANLGPVGICIDVAHGHSDKMVRMVGDLKKHYPTLEVIAGNICTARAYHDLVNAGADAIKVGIGPGAACTTRMVTGFGVPQFTAIRDCAEEAQHFRVPIIADGGIRNSADIVKALAAGAATVMMGKLFALTEESAAEKRMGYSTKWRLKEKFARFTDAERYRIVCDETMVEATPSGMEAKYRGQASEDFQNEFYGGLKHKTVAEGVDFWAPVTGSARETIDQLLGGIRIGMTYGGARNIKELQRKAEFVKVSAAYDKESNPRRI
jgi:IMP dehydrogenase